jgi:preprotein translocase SecY subunit
VNFAMPRRFLDLMEPITRYLPEIVKPKRKVSLKEKFLWTALALSIYLIMAEIPLLGVPSSSGYDSFYFYRVIFASKRGSLMELGIGPIVTAGLIMQILAGAKIMNVNLNDPKDRGLFTGTQKFLAIVMTAFEGIAFFLGGAYGTTTLNNGVAIIIQLIAVGILVILLDELIQKGWGLGSGVSLFILAGVAQTVIWQSFSPLGPVADGASLGAVLAFIQFTLAGNPLAAFTRSTYASMTGFIMTLIVFFVAVYLEGMKIEIPVAYAKYGGMRAKIPLKFMYVSNIPVILASALFSNVFLLGNIVWANFNSANNNVVFNWFVMKNATSGSYMPGSFVYYISSPNSITGVLADPFRALTYLLILVGLSVIFAVVWVQVAGMTAKSQADQLVNAGMQIPGFRRSPAIIEQIMNRYIPSLTIISGIAIGLMAGGADMLGALGSGTGILLSVGIIYQYYQILAKEQLAETYPGLGKLMGQG